MSQEFTTIGCFVGTKRRLESRRLDYQVKIRKSVPMCEYLDMISYAEPRQGHEDAPESSNGSSPDPESGCPKTEP